MSQLVVRVGEPAQFATPVPKTLEPRSAWAPGPRIWHRVPSRPLRHIYPGFVLRAFSCRSAPLILLTYTRSTPHLLALGTGSHRDTMANTIPSLDLKESMTKSSSKHDEDASPVDNITPWQCIVRNPKILLWTLYANSESAPFLSSRKKKRKRRRIEEENWLTSR
jgi:hypothetical protein